MGALHETGGADGVGHVAVVVPTARVPGVSFRVDQDGRQLRARQVLLVPVHVADAEERRLVAHRCSHEELPSERFADPRDADQGAGHPAPRDILGADAGGALRLAGSRGPLGGLSQHTGWASGGTQRLPSLRGRPEHRLGGTRRAQCRRSGVCFRHTVRASLNCGLNTAWDSSTVLLEVPAETPAGVTFVSLRMLIFGNALGPDEEQFRTEGLAKEALVVQGA